MAWLGSIITSLFLAVPWFAVACFWSWRQIAGKQPPHADSIKRAYQWSVVGGGVMDGLLSVAVVSLYLADASANAFVAPASEHWIARFLLLLVPVLLWRFGVVVYAMMLTSHWCIVIIAVTQALASSPAVAYVEGNANGADQEPVYWSPVPTRSLLWSILWVILLTGAAAALGWVLVLSW